jgi:hypothetical protein
LLDIGCAPIFLHFYRFDRSFDPPDPVVSTHESVAAHYGVPSINVGRAVERSLAGGKERLTAWFTDGIHMTDAGAEYVTELLGTALRTLFEDGIESAVSRTPLPTPLHERNYQNTMVVPASAAMLRHPQRCTAGSLRFVYPYIRFESDNEMEFADEGELAGIIVVVGRESGVIRIRTGSTEREIPLWDEYAFYDRYGTVLFDPPLPPRTALSLRLTDAAVDYSPCVRPLGDTATIRKQLKVIGFMVRP